MPCPTVDMAVSVMKVTMMMMMAPVGLAILLGMQQGGPQPLTAMLPELY